MVGNYDKKKSNPHPHSFMMQHRLKPSSNSALYWIWQTSDDEARVSSKRNRRSGKGIKIAQFYFRKKITVLKTDIVSCRFYFWAFFLRSTEIEERKDFRGTKGTLVKFEKCGFLDFRIKLNIFSRFLEFRFDKSRIESSNCVESKC